MADVTCSHAQGCSRNARSTAGQHEAAPSVADSSLGTCRNPSSCTASTTCRVWQGSTAAQQAPSYCPDTQTRIHTQLYCCCSFASLWPCSAQQSWSKEVCTSSRDSAKPSVSSSHAQVCQSLYVQAPSLDVMLTQVVARHAPKQPTLFLETCPHSHCVAKHLLVQQHSTCTLVCAYLWGQTLVPALLNACSVHA